MSRVANLPLGSFRHSTILIGMKLKIESSLVRSRATNIRRSSKYTRACGIRPISCTITFILPNIYTGNAIKFIMRYIYDIIVEATAVQTLCKMMTKIQYSRCFKVQTLGGRAVAGAWQVAWAIMAMGAISMRTAN